MVVEPQPADADELSTAPHPSNAQTAPQPDLDTNRMGEETHLNAQYCKSQHKCAMSPIRTRASGSSPTCQPQRSGWFQSAYSTR